MDLKTENIDTDNVADLKTGNVTRLLSVSEEELLALIREKNLPAYKIKNRYHFSLSELGEWILANRHLVQPAAEIYHRLTKRRVSLTALLYQGGIYYDIPGITVAESIRNAVAVIRIPDDLSREDVYTALMQREGMMSTAVGKGIAFPHPRCPIISDIDNESLSLCFLKESVDYKAHDDEPVRVLFVIISSNPGRHLEILSKISFLCQHSAFVSLLRRPAEKESRQKYEESLRESIENAETDWLNAQKG
ncbi:MAG: PTS sugar transporter subunit IIA [Desulfobacterales bacterium]